MTDEPGWRYDPNSQRMRFWTGSAWTEQFGATAVSLPQRGINPFLFWMLIVGLLLFLVGLVWGIAAIGLLDRSSPLSSDYGIALRESIAASSIAGFGITLLVIAWAVAALRWNGRNPEYQAIPR